jgi:uncharacterized protein YbbC (DUF1343 family)
MFDKVVGSNQIRFKLEDGQSVPAIKASWQEELDKFLMIRQKYLLYQ